MDNTCFFLMNIILSNHEIINEVNFTIDYFFWLYNSTRFTFEIQRYKLISLLELSKKIRKIELTSNIVLISCLTGYTISLIWKTKNNIFLKKSGV